MNIQDLLSLDMLKCFDTVKKSLASNVFLSVSKS